jgi:NitT/TauT family transport system substrate-binding protein
MLNIKIGVIPSDFGMSRFLADPALVQQCFITNEPYYVRKQGAEIGVLLLSETGFSPYRVWYVRRNFLQQRPEIIRAFTTASIRGWQDYLDGDRSAADALIATRNPKMETEFMEYSVHAMQQYRLVSGDSASGEATGQIRRERLETQIHQLAKLGLLDHTPAVEDVFDPRFLSTNSLPSTAEAK